MNPSRGTSDRPIARLRVMDAVAMIVGIVVGAGIFRAPSMVAQGADGPWALLALWVLGGAVSMVGALCYAELACAFPDAGGEYHFLGRAFGRKVAFLFAWARLTIIPTGSIALLAFVFGDYLAQLAPLGAGANVLYAGVLVVSLTAVNVMGLRFGRTLQNVCTGLVVAGLLGITAAGLVLGAAVPPAPVAAAAGGGTGGVGVGLAMVFVLLTYGGWNEAAYLSSEVRGGRRSVALALVGGVAAVTVLYVLVNLAYLRGLGLAGLQGSEAVAADLMRNLTGPWGMALVSVLIAAAAVTSANATVVMGSRTGYALGRDFGAFRPLGRWDRRADAPVRALLVQGGLALGLVALGGLSRRGFETMVEYTAPVFWAFFLLTGVALLVLRRREPDAPRPFRVPLYPLTPLIFCASSAWLLYSSVAYTRAGAAVGVGVLALGAIPLWLEGRRHPTWSSTTKEKQA
jgi:APA family basic amino acid/polyamine antiporter